MFFIISLFHFSLLLIYFFIVACVIYYIMHIL